MSNYDLAKPETFGEGQSVIDVTAHFDDAQWSEYGDGLSSAYKQANRLEVVTNDGPWDSRYEGSGYLLGLYRDADDCYWELSSSEDEQSLHYIGKREDVIAMIED